MKRLRSILHCIHGAPLAIGVAGLFLAAAPLQAVAQDGYEDWEYEVDEGYHQEEWYDPSDWFDLDNQISYESEYYDYYDYYDYDNDGYYGYTTWNDPYDPYEPYGVGYDDYDPYVYNQYDYDPYDAGLDDYDPTYDYYIYTWNPDTGDYERQRNDRNQQRMSRQQRDTDQQRRADRDRRNRNQQRQQNRDWWNDDQDQQRRADRNRWNQDQQRRADRDWWNDDQQRQADRNQADRNQWNRSQQNRDQRMASRDQQQDRRRMEQQRRQTQRERFGTQVRGEIVDMTEVDVFENTHVLAKIESTRGNTCVVDLGPKQKLSQLNLSKGDRIRVDGRRAMMVAGRVKANDQTVTIDRRWKHDQDQQREMRHVRGKVDQIKTKKCADGTHLVAYLDSGQGWLHRVDLGKQKKANQLDLQKGDKIEVRGVRGEREGEAMLIAKRVRTWDDGKSETTAQRENRKQRERDARQQRERNTGNNRNQAR